MWKLESSANYELISSVSMKELDHGGKMNEIYQPNCCSCPEEPGVIADSATDIEGRGSVCGTVDRICEAETWDCV